MRRVLIALFMVLMISFAVRILMSQRGNGIRGEASASGETARVLQSPATQSVKPPVDQRSMEHNLRGLLEVQAAAWNRGDIDEFMSGYWRSPKTVFAGASGVQRGWNALLERYKQNYPNRAAMGHLAFSELEITPLSVDAAVILGHWQLQREKDAPHGIFTLIARHFPEGWRIIHDHTSAAATPPAH